MLTRKRDDAHRETAWMMLSGSLQKLGDICFTQDNVRESFSSHSAFRSLRSKGTGIQTLASTKPMRTSMQFLTSTRSLPFTGRMPKNSDQSRNGGRAFHERFDAWPSERHGAKPVSAPTSDTPSNHKDNFGDHKQFRQ